VPKTCATWADALGIAVGSVKRLGVGRAGLGSAGGGMIFGLMGLKLVFLVVSRVMSLSEATLGSMIGIGKNQRQEAGDGSQQIQVAGNLIQVNGVTEQRAVEIAKEQSRIAIQEFTAEAAARASSRIEKLDEKVVTELSSDGLLEAFSDPAFQILLRKAQLQAAATSDETDYELLSKLLKERAGKPSKPVHMVVSRAVEVVEYLDSAALIGMMFLWLVGTTAPSATDPKMALFGLDKLVSKLLDDGKFPSGASWLQRLGLMDCIYYQSGGAIRTEVNKWQQIQLKNRPGYICEGIASEDVGAVRSKLDQIIPNLGSLVVDHPFLPGRFRINAFSSTELLKILEIHLQGIHAPDQALKLWPGRANLETLGNREKLREILLEARLDTVSAEAESNILKYVETDLPNLQALRTWWDNLSGITGITPVGIAVGFSNAKRFDSLTGLPALSELIDSAS
jgi:hypothetical protein